GAGAGDRHAVGGRVAEAAGLLVLAALDVVHGPLDAVGRHVAAEVLAAAQGHDLPAGHAHVAAAGVLHGVAPAAALLAGGALRLEDDRDGLLQLLAHLLA